MFWEKMWFLKQFCEFFLIRAIFNTKHLTMILLL